VKQISDNEIYLLIKYIKSFLSRVAKCLSYIEEARCPKVNAAAGPFCRSNKKKVTAQNHKMSQSNDGCDRYPKHVE